MALAVIPIFGALQAFGQAGPASSPIQIAYLTLTVEHVLPLSYLDQPPEDDGLEGARLGLIDNQTTGQFLGQSYRLDEASAADDDGVIAAFKQKVASGEKLFVTDLPAKLLLRVADLPEAKGITILDATSKDDALRGADCRRSTLHTMPSRAMLADALMQYMMIKKWSKIALVVGGDPADKLYADAIRNSAHKFRIKIVKEIPWSFDPGARRTDTGAYAEEAEVARITQDVGDYDLLIVADEADNFGDELAYRTTEPRPVAGTEGMTPTAWARPFEQWGATQLQSRFLKLAKTLDDGKRLRRLARRPRDRRGGDARQYDRPGRDRQIHARQGFRCRRLQGDQIDFQGLGWTITPTRPARRCAVAGVSVAAARISARILRARYARRRPPGDEMPYVMKLPALSSSPAK